MMIPLTYDEHLTRIGLRIKWALIKTFPTIFTSRLWYERGVSQTMRDTLLEAKFQKKNAEFMKKNHA